ncbi:hypothetical protein QMK19_08865 [Streptomyces sp. H10-C2]|uniref:hypothetical protein n=1 Tax=unclassified Streptomyces TaxID=2593676 RepID=UPI0024BBB6EF|nr:MULTISPECIES: hypothetical protein [unclassified Streptomyces]MDJ0340983.1 hypothetical protein [Streptomyces sp. PH10-H1]MDJ0369785.1 hypothetical protein [Streptomyces sp. H10-C2]
MTAAARAAAKRAEKAHRAQLFGRVVVVEPPETAEPPKGQRQPPAQEPRKEQREQEATAAAKPSRRRSGLLSAVLAVLVVAGLLATSMLGWQYRETERTRHSKADALAAVLTAAPVILSYDYRYLDRDFAAADRFLTGSFRDQYRKTTTTVVKPTAAQYHGVVKATVAKPPAGGAPAVSVLSGSADKVTVLLFMNQVTTSTKVAGPRLDLNRVRMTLVRTSQGWKVSAVDAL